MANPYADNPFANPYAAMRQYLPPPGTDPWADYPGMPARRGISTPGFDPVPHGLPPAPPPATPQGIANPYAPGQAWQSPTDETTRTYYTRNPQEAMSLYARAAGGSLGGNLERFIRQAFGDLWSDYTRANQTQDGLMFTDTLTPEKRNELWGQWRAQTPRQRGENDNLFGGAGRRV